MKRVFSLIFVLFSVVCVVISIRVYISYIQQKTLLTDLAFNNSSSKVKEIEGFIDRFPNITVTTIPIKALKAKYYKNEQEYDKALELCFESLQYNKYLMMTESTLADIYDEINEKDSFNYYSELAYTKLPNNAQHLLRYIKKIRINDELNKMDSLYQLKKEYLLSNKGEDFMLVFLSGLVEKDSVSSNKKHIDIANLAKQKFKNNTSINKISNLIIYGLNNIRESEKLIDLAVDHINIDDFVIAERYLKNSINLFPENIDAYENLNRIYYEEQDFLKIKENSDFILNNFETDDGVVELLYGISLNELGEKSEGCSFINKSIFKKNKQAYSYKKRYCN